MSFSAPAEDNGFLAYQNAHISHWNTVAQLKKPQSSFSVFYRNYLQKIYGFYIPAGLRVLELGCGRGDLLNAMRPSYGVGVDFAPAMLDTARAAHPHLHFVQADAHALTPLTLAGHGDAPFDVIILSDLVNDAWDVHLIFEELRPLCAPNTRIILNFHSQLWEHPFGLVQKLGYVTSARQHVLDSEPLA